MIRTKCFFACVQTLLLLSPGVPIFASAQQTKSSRGALPNKRKEVVGLEVFAGTNSYHAGKYADAMDHFEAALKKDRRDAKARGGETKAATEWAARQVNLGRADEAMTVLERAIQQLPDEPKLLVSFGLEAIALHQDLVAEQALTTAYRLQPDSPETTYALARLALDEQHLADAERDLKAYLVMRPRDASAYYGLGHIYAMEQRDDDAQSAFQSSLTLRPAQTESYYQLGQLDLQAQREKEARQMFAKVLERDPHHAGALTGMGELALRAKDYVRAEQLLSSAERSDPAYPSPHYFRGLALARLGRKEEAQVEMQRGDSRPHVNRDATPDTSAATADLGTQPH